jgi:hypothetical protein
MIIFVFFNFFFAFWPFPWQRQPFWKNQPLKAQLHMTYDISTRFHKFDQGISEKCVGQTFDGRKKERKKKNNNKNNKKRSKHNMSPKLCLGDIITPK